MGQNKYFRKIVSHDSLPSPEQGNDGTSVGTGTFFHQRPRECLRIGFRINKVRIRVRIRVRVRVRVKVRVRVRVRVRGQGSGVRDRIRVYG